MKQTIGEKAESKRRIKERKKKPKRVWSKEVFYVFVEWQNRAICTRHDVLKMLKEKKKWKRDTREKKTFRQNGMTGNPSLSATYTQKK